MSGDKSGDAIPVMDAVTYWLPTHSVKSAWVGHAPFASWIIAALEPKTVVELGTHNGFSFFAFAEAAKRLGLSTALYAVDTWSGDDQAGFYGDEIFDLVQRVASERYPATVHLVRARFSDAVESFEDGSIDLLHIDGRHGFNDVKEDYDLYFPKLSNRAVVLFHDTNEFQEGFGVHKMWDEIAPTGPSFNFHHSHGLGVLSVGAEVPDRVLDFLAAANADPERMRAAFENASLQAVEYNYRAVETPKYIQGIEERNAHLVGDLAHSDRQMREAKDELTETKNDLEEVRVRLERIQSSASWKITRPIRRMLALRRRFTDG